jgi:DNA-binding CsgD family transcriptional regulator
MEMVEGAVERRTLGVEGLTDRQLEILELIGQGRSTPAIARQLNLSVKTVESHRSHIRTKLNLKNTFDLLHYAIRWIESEGLPPRPTGAGRSAPRKRR